MNFNGNNIKHEIFYIDFDKSENIIDIISLILAFFDYIILYKTHEQYK